MTQEKEQELLNKIVQQIVGAVTFAEIVKIIHSIATREATEQLKSFTEEEKEEVYAELIQPQKVLSNLSGQETPVV